MWRQNDLFRRHASGNWRRMLTEVTKDPAMLIWLDQARSCKQHPNENYAREVMELFTLGEGHYTEADVIQGARALTGWTLDRIRQEPVYRERLHDEGVKTFLGRTGRLATDDVLDRIVAQPADGRFIWGKLWRFFAGDQPAPEGVVEALAAEFRERGLEFKPVLRTLLRSEVFYSDKVIRNQI